MKPKTSVEDLFSEARRNKTFIKVQAPMVRYSRLEFRSLVRNYGVDLNFTPMLIANSFNRSEKARIIDFTTNNDDTPLIVQFAANNDIDFLHAAKKIYPYSDGIDLNCGCPQRWTYKDGYGCALLRKPEKIEDMVKAVRRNLPASFAVSVKIRLLSKKINQTIDLCRQLEKLNLTFITIHGRTQSEKTCIPVDVEAVAEIKKSLQLPVIFNGDVKSLEGAESIYQQTNCDGAMAARGILSNPAMFAGYSETPLSCVQEWLNIHEKQQDRMSIQNFHHHLTFMLESVLAKGDRKTFNDFTKKTQVLEFLGEKLNMLPQTVDYPDNLECTYDDTEYNSIAKKLPESSTYSNELSNGKFFTSNKNKVDDEDLLENCNIFDCEQ